MILEFRIAAFMNFMRPKGPEYTLEESDWNDMTVSLLESADSRG